jgi:hypothetical protein
MRASIALLMRGMRWRLGISILTVLTAAVAVGAAVLGPLYLNTAGDSVVRTAVRSASEYTRGATLAAPPGQTVSLGKLQQAEQAVQRAGGQGRFYGSPITSVTSSVALSRTTRRCARRCSRAPISAPSSISAPGVACSAPARS